MEKKGEHPALQILQLYGPSPVGDQNRAALRQKIAEVAGNALPEITGQFSNDTTMATSYTLPLDAFVASRVARIEDGEEIIDLPRLQQWVGWFRDIISGGYETGRERWKIKRASHCANANDIVAGSVEPVKGFTRLSIILWSLHHGIAYMETAMDSITMEQFDVDYAMFKTYSFHLLQITQTRRTLQHFWRVPGEPAGKLITQTRRKKTLHPNSPEPTKFLASSRRTRRTNASPKLAGKLITQTRRKTLHPNSPEKTLHPNSPEQAKFLASSRRTRRKTLHPNSPGKNHPNSPEQAKFLDPPKNSSPTQLAGELFTRTCFSKCFFFLCSHCFFFLFFGQISPEKVAQLCAAVSGEIPGNSPENVLLSLM